MELLLLGIIIGLLVGAMLTYFGYKGFLGTSKIHQPQSNVKRNLSK